MEVEAIAVCRVVDFGSEIGMDCAIMEGDSKVIVKALKNNDNGLTPFAPLINDVSYFWVCFQNCHTLTLEEMATKLLIV